MGTKATRAALTAELSAIRSTSAFLLFSFRLPFLFALLLIADCSTRDAVDRRYTDLLSSRLAFYKSLAAEQDQQIRAKIKQDAAVLVRTDTSADQSSQILADMVKSIISVSETRGKAAVLERFMNEGAQSAQIGFMSSWLQNEFRTAQALDLHVRDRVEAFGRAPPKDGKQWVSELESIAVQRGMVNGAADELARLWSDLQGYARDYGVATQEDMQRAQAFFAFAASVQTYAYQQQLLNALNRPRTCQAFGASVTCY